MSYTNTHTKIHTRSQALSLDAHFERLTDDDLHACAHFLSLSRLNRSACPTTTMYYVLCASYVLAHIERLSDHDYVLCAGYVLAHFERLFDDDYVRCAGNVLCGGSL